MAHRRSGSTSSDHLAGDGRWGVGGQDHDDDARPEGPSLTLLPYIARLAEEPALSFVYWCLDRVVATGRLTDAVVVVDHPALGRQAFRRGGRPLDPSMAPLLEGPAPALWTEPDVFRHADLTAVAELCAVALRLDVAVHDAAHDPLTGLLNRRAFSELLEVATSQSARYGWGFTLLMADIDGFKQLNDELGHLEGDRLLERFGAELRRCLRSGDAAGRVGGDEFAVIAFNASPASARLLRQRLGESLATTAGRRLRVSVGAAVAPDDSIAPDELYRLADARLYQDKRR